MADRAPSRLSLVPRKAEAPLLHPNMGREEALKAIVASCLDHYRANEAPLLAGGDKETLHQARVALRRMRSALSLIVPMLPRNKQLEKQRKELERLTRKFGAVRELDVLVERSGPSLRDALLAHREQAYARLARRLRRRKTQRLLSELSEWSRQPSSGEARLWASELLDERLARVRKRGKKFGALSARKRHRLRIEVKKLRYGAEFFASLFTEKKAQSRCASFVETLSSLQDLLGELNDLDTGSQVLESYGLAAEPVEKPQSRRRLLEDAQAEWREAVHSKPFWHER